jgi:hypothetical protein
MFGSVILDVVIGLVLVYFLYSLLATTINEIIASVLKSRSEKLKMAIKRMLVDDNAGFTGLSTKLLDHFYGHPLIKYMSRDGKRAPSFISAENFSKVVVDSLKTMGNISGNFSPAALSSVLASLKKPLAVPEEMSALLKKYLDKGSYDDFRKELGEKIKSGKGELPSVLKNLLESFLKNPKYKADKFRKEVSALLEPNDTIRLFESFLSDANGDLEKFRKYLEKWFDDMMDRATGWYKRKTQIVIFIIGFSLALIFNVDTIQIVKTLSVDKNAREQMIGLAKSYVEKKKEFNHSDSLELDSLLTLAKQQINGDVSATNAVLGLGWNAPKNVHWVKEQLAEVSKENTITGKLMKIIVCIFTFLKKNFLAFIGWIITTLAISLGAPFWFDLLNKFMSLRGSGPKPAASASSTTASPATGEVPILERKG